jgi:hypothetical protein
MLSHHQLITTGQELFALLVSHARSSGTTATYPTCVIRLTDRVINHLLDDGDMEDLSSGGLSPLRRLAEAAARDITERATLQPFSTALVDLAIGLYDGDIGCPVVALARRLGFHEDGLAFEFIEGRWYIVSTARFEQETGYAVRSFGGTFPGGLPILSDVSWDGTPLD